MSINLYQIFSEVQLGIPLLKNIGDLLFKVMPILKPESVIALKKQFYEEVIRR